MKKERNHAFDILCGICIVRMVSLHVMIFCGKADTAWWQEVMQWTFFFMCFFFFKAGYFNKGVSPLSDREYWIDRTKRLFVPYLCSGLLGGLVYFSFYFPLVSRYHKFVEPLRWSHIWEDSSFYGNQPVWFLFSFYVMYLAVRYLEKVSFSKWLVPFFPLVSYALYLLGNPLWMGVNCVFMGIFFFYLGRAWRQLLKRWGPSRMRKFSWLLVAGFVACNLAFPGTYTMSRNAFDGSALGAMASAILALCGLSGVLLTMPLRRIPLLCFIGEHSMVYFISHYPLLYFYKFMHLSFGRSIYNRTEEIFILIPLVFCLCSWFVPYIESIPLLSGRWEKRTVPHS